MWTGIFVGVILLNLTILVIADYMYRARMTPNEREIEELKNDFMKGMNDPW